MSEPIERAIREARQEWLEAREAVDRLVEQLYAARMAEHRAYLRLIELESPEMMRVMQAYLFRDRDRKGSSPGS